MFILSRAQRISAIFALATSLSLLATVAASTTTHATFALFQGRTQVYGTDRVSGEVSTSSNPVSKVMVYPGDTIRFRAQAWNIGDWGGTVNMRVVNKYLDGSKSNGSAAKPYALTDYDRHYWLFSARVNFFPNDPVKITGAGSTTPGNTFCQYVDLYNARTDFLGMFALGGTFDNASSMGCAEVAYNYELKPSVALDPAESKSTGSAITLKTSIAQVAPHATNTKPTDWRVTKFIVNSGAAIPNSTGGTSATEPCTPPKSGYFGGAPVKSCATLNYKDTASVTRTAAGSNFTLSASGAVTNAGTPIAFPAGYPTTVDSLAYGEQLCYALSVRTYKPYANQWSHSAPVCIKSETSKKPKVQVLGGDTRSRARIMTSTEIKTIGSVARHFGSWGEYASFSSGVTKGFGSGSTLRGGPIAAPGVPLTFANSTPTALGEFSTAAAFAPIPPVQSFFADKTTAGASSPPASASLDTLASSKTPYVVSSGDITLTGGSIAAGKTVIVVASGNVTIAGNITYANGPFTKLGDIPQVVIIAKNINIAESVTTVDAWLIVDTSSSGPDGTINTCSPKVATGNLTINDCSDRLTVSGPVAARQILLHRTAGSEDEEASGDPAEVFNLRADAYLWATNYQADDIRLFTTSTIELPPRF